MELNERVGLFRDMVLCCHNLYLWIYSAEYELLESNCPDVELVRNLFQMGGSREFLAQYAQEHTKPLLMTNSLGLMWIAIPYRMEEELEKIYILGPFFTADLSEKTIEDALQRVQLKSFVEERLRIFLRSLPVVSQNRIFEYAVMLYYCITEQRILVSDLHYQESEPLKVSGPPSSPGVSDVHGTYAMEQEMVRMVREGNLNYQKHISRLAVSGTLGKLSDNPDRHLKNAVLVCIILFSRAAIEGGLSPEIAMTLTDHYFQSVESCKNIQELQEIARTMQDDFVQRVHRARSSVLSKPIQEVCDYINLHLEDNPSLGEIAEQLKYSKYYLSHKFEKEMGLSIGSYVMQRRLAKAADLLRSNTLTVKEIGERLHFCSPSYFSKQFKAVYGVKPTEWAHSQQANKTK